MINKRLLLGSFDDLPAVLLKVGSNGVDDKQMDKLAGENIFKHADLKEEPGHVYIRLITTGDGDTYGSNSNGDFFNESSRIEHFPEPCKEASVQLDDGLTGYHKTYMEYGGVYHNHNNSRKGYEKQGEVVCEAYNKDMHRGELIIKIAEDLKDEKTGKYVWHDTIEKLANDKPVAFSQGCSIAADLCSICGWKAETSKNRCSHIKYGKNKLHKSGKQAYMINDKPFFHDISEVLKPADRIALALEKVASGERVEREFFNNEGIYIPVELMNKLGTKDEQDRYNLLVKLSEMEKRVPMIAEDIRSSLGCATKLDEPEEQEVVDTLKGIPPDFMLDRLNKSNMMLTPRTFTIIVLDKSPSEVPGFDSIPGLLKDVFTELREHEDPNEILSDGSYKPGSPLFVPQAEDKIKSLSGLLSLDHEPVQNRVIKISITGNDKKVEKTAAEPTAEAGIIAKEYAKYQLSFLASGKADDRKELLTVLSNNY